MRSNSESAVSVRRRNSELISFITLLVMSSMKNTPKVTTAATTWLCVAAEIMTPMAMLAHPISKKPTYADIISPQLGEPSIASITGYMKLSSSVIAKTVTAAKNLPITTEMMRTGDVRSS